MDEYTARQILRDAAMRQALWEWLMEHRPKESDYPWPSPTPPSDDRIREDLERILFPKRKKFLGIF